MNRYKEWFEGAKPKKKQEFEPPSEDFTDAFITGGCAIAECYCGITHFNPSTCADYEEEEFRELLKLAKAEPEKFIESDWESSTIEIDGKYFVADCPCNLLRRYEDWIWMHRHQIIRYLDKRSGRELTSAEIERDELERARNLANLGMIRTIRL